MAITQRCQFPANIVEIRPLLLFTYLLATLLFHQIEPQKRGNFQILPSSITRNSQELKTKIIFQIQRGILEIIQFIQFVHLEKHNISERAGMAMPCQCGPQESLTGFQKIFLFWVSMRSQQCWKANLERPNSLGFNLVKKQRDTHSNIKRSQCKESKMHIGIYSQNFFHSTKDQTILKENKRVLNSSKTRSLG